MISSMFRRRAQEAEKLLETTRRSMDIQVQAGLALSLRLAVAEGKLRRIRALPFDGSDKGALDLHDRVNAIVNEPRG